MRKKDCFFLGRIVKKYGYKGEVLVKLEVDQPAVYESLKFAYLTFDHYLIPYFIKDSKLHKTELLRVSFEDVQSEQKAEGLLKRELYLPLGYLPKLSGKRSFYYHELIGFTVSDINYGRIGGIKDVNDKTPQLLLVIESDKRELLLPLEDKFIQEINERKKTLEVCLPTELIDFLMRKT